MRRKVTAALGVTLAVGTLVASAAPAAAPAAAPTTGRESFRGVIVASGESGTRTVVSSLIVARGVFSGVGRIVEVDNRPGDPENVSRDDLVFPQGTMHLRSTSNPPQISLNPQTCTLTVRIRQTGRIEGGTRRFRRASGRAAGTVRAWGVAARNPDGTCSQEADLLLESDVVSARGTLSF